MQRLSLPTWSCNSTTKSLVNSLSLCALAMCLSLRTETNVLRNNQNKAENAELANILHELRLSLHPHIAYRDLRSYYYED